MAKCMRHSVVDVQGMKLMGIASLRSIASVCLGDSTSPVATTLTLNSHLLFQSPELSHDYIYPQHPEFSREEINTIGTEIERSRLQTLIMMCLKAKKRHELSLHAQLISIEVLNDERAYR